MKREEIIRDLVERSSGAGAGQYMSIRCDVAREIVALLKEQETMPSYNDAVDTIKFQSKVLGLVCEILAGWESEDPCNTLLYIKEQREKCEERCCCDKTPDEWCWRRYLALMVTEDSPTPEQMRDTSWEEESV